MSSTTEGMTDSFDDAEDVLTEVVAQEVVITPVDRRMRHLWRQILVSRNLALTLVGVIIFIFFAITAPDTFLSSNNLINMMRNVARTGIVAVGMTYLMIAGEIDLSVGSVFGFLTVVLGVLVVRNGVDIWVASLVTIVLGGLVGALNGILTTRLGIPSFIVTLAMLSGYRSLAITVAEQKPWNGPGTGLFYQIIGGDLQLPLGAVKIDIPMQIIWMFIIMIVGGVILAKSKFGYHIYAVGGSEEAARNSGINTKRVKMACFIITSALCGFIALLLFGDLNIAAPITGTGFELNVIGAVIVGGIALNGGRGTIYGVFIGAIIISMITSGLVLLGLSQQYGDIATGLLIVGIGTMDLLVRRAGARSLGYLEG